MVVVSKNEIKISHIRRKCHKWNQYCYANLSSYVQQCNYIYPRELFNSNNLSNSFAKMKEIPDQQLTRFL